ncbi:MAG: Global regulator protein family [Bacillales bacterium]|nr:Global regulator protein family [Bacillales bacterium]
MLIIGRDVGESVIIVDEIKITLLQKGSNLEIAIDAPLDIEFNRVKQIPNNLEKFKKKARIIGETIQIGESIKVSVIQTETGLIRFAIDAPKEISVFREEIYPKGKQIDHSLKRQITHKSLRFTS